MKSRKLQPEMYCSRPDVKFSLNSLMWMEKLWPLFVEEEGAIWRMMVGVDEILLLQEKLD